MNKKIPILIIFLILSAGLVYYLGFEKTTVVVIKGSVSVFQSRISSYEIKFYGMEAKVNAFIEDMTRINYMLAQKGKPHVTHSQPMDMSDIVNLTIIFRLTTPSNKTLEFEPLELGKGGVHNFTLYIGESEGVKGEGVFKLEITFRLEVSTPKGSIIVDMERTITVYFELPKKTVNVVEH